MFFFNLADLKSREVIPGYHAKFIHSDHMTFAYWDIKKDALLPQHSHPEEQVAHLLEGIFELTIDDQTRVLKPGIIGVIPANVKHSGKAITDCKILDVFYPVRGDYK